MLQTHALTNGYLLARHPNKNCERPTASAEGASEENLGRFGLGKPKFLTLFAAEFINLEISRNILNSLILRIVKNLRIH